MPFRPHHMFSVEWDVCTEVRSSTRHCSRSSRPHAFILIFLPPLHTPFQLLPIPPTLANSHRVHPSRCFHIQGVSFSLLDMSSQSVDRSWCGERCLTSQSIRRWCATVARLRHENNGGFHALQGEDGWLQGPAQTMCIAMLSHYTRD